MKKETILLETEKRLKKRILITGSTGSIGSYLASYLLSIGREVFLSSRDEKKLMVQKEKLEKEYSKKVEYIVCDFTKKEDVDNLLKKVFSFGIEVIFLNAGIYHQDKSYISRFEKTFLVDYLLPSYFLSKLYEVNNEVETIITGSISYEVSSFKKDDFYGERYKNKTVYYGYIKRLLMMKGLKLNSLSHPVYIAHPGVTYTNLFSKDNGGHSAFFYKFITPMMKFIFMDVSKASLALLYASYDQDKYLYGPKHFFHLYGEPNKSKFRKSLYNDLDDFIQIDKGLIDSL